VTSTPDDILRACRDLEAWLGPPPPAAYRAHPADVAALRKLLPVVDDADPLLCIRIHNDQTRERNSCVPMTADEERAWLSAQATP
jgi:hypothetical protein